MTVLNKIGPQKPRLKPATARSSIIRDPTGPLSAPANGKCLGRTVHTKGKAAQKQLHKIMACAHFLYSTKVSLDILSYLCPFHPSPPTGLQTGLPFPAHGLQPLHPHHSSSPSCLSPSQGLSRSPVPSESNEWLSDGPTIKLDRELAYAPNSSSNIHCPNAWIKFCAHFHADSPNNTAFPCPEGTASKADPTHSPFLGQPHIPMTLAFELGPMLSTPMLFYFSTCSCKPSATGKGMWPSPASVPSDSYSASVSGSMQLNHALDVLIACVRTAWDGIAMGTGATARSLCGSSGMNEPSGRLPDTGKHGDSVDSVGQRWPCDPQPTCGQGRAQSVLEGCRVGVHWRGGHRAWCGVRGC